MSQIQSSPSKHRISCPCLPCYTSAGWVSDLCRPTAELIQTYLCSTQTVLYLGINLLCNCDRYLGNTVLFVYNQRYFLKTSSFGVNASFGEIFFWGKCYNLRSEAGLERQVRYQFWSLKSYQLSQEEGNTITTRTSYLSYSSYFLSVDLSVCLIYAQLRPKKNGLSVNINLYRPNLHLVHNKSNCWIFCSHFLCLCNFSTSSSLHISHNRALEKIQLNITCASSQLVYFI